MANVLKRPVLVLNKNWMPISVSTVEDAIGRIYTNNATVVDHENYIKYSWDDWVERGVKEGNPFVPGANGFKFECPEVIVLANYTDVPQRAIHYSKHSVLRRDHYCCAYCGEQFDKDVLTIDHVIPRSQGGKTSWENCVACCKPCNHHKADRTPEQAGMKLKVVPHRPSWLECRKMVEMAEKRPAWQVFVKIGGE